MNDLLIKGLTEKEAQALEKKNIRNIPQFLRRLPLHYYDFTTPLPLNIANEEVTKRCSNQIEFAVVGTMVYFDMTFKNHMAFIKIRVKERTTGNLLFVNILGQYKKADFYKECMNKEVIVGGKILFSKEYACFSVLNPVYFSEYTKGATQSLIQYSKLSPIKDERYKEIVEEAVQEAPLFNEFIPAQFVESLHILSFAESLKMPHEKYSDAVKKEMHKRIMAEDLLYMAAKMRLQECDHKKEGIVFPNATLMGKYISSFPYELTSDQQEVLHFIKNKMYCGVRVNALVQGDVGTGKTAVAFSLAFLCAGSGFQTIIMAPYTTLARQHYEEIKKYAEPLGVTTVLLTSELKASEKKEAVKKIESGNAKIIIGTHSVVGKNVRYKNLALVIADEEHKFGVIQKEALGLKALPGCHEVVMSATPIPKTLSDTIYGNNVDALTIKTKPANRLPVKTAVCKNDKTAADFMIKECKNGHQCYIVCPSIEENDKGYSIEEKVKRYGAFFKENNIKMAVLTGKMKAEEKAAIMKEFSEGKISVLMATTVIEVGINVPNATVITIVGADRFGFSTLHQLRGRVGRGSDQSYCILQVDDVENEKLQYLCKENDGFEIAKKDLEMRGPGALFGEAQAGYDDRYIMAAYLNKPTYDKIKVWIAAMKLNEVEKYIASYEKLILAIDEPENQEKLSDKKEQKTQKEPEKESKIEGGSEEMATEFTYKIEKHLATLSTSPKGWTTEVNLISWNGQEAKVDIRSWSPDKEKMGKGISLTKEEFEAMKGIEV